MSARLKKISIDELQIGMFIVEMDISWIKSPFLRHRRSIENNKDILLLKKSGVKKITIDLDKAQLRELIEESDEIISVIESPSKSAEQEIIADSAKLDQPSVALNEELIRAQVLKSQAKKSFVQINNAVKANQTVPVELIAPVIDETVTSLLRNSQALLTLMNLKRYEEKLFSHSFSVMTLALTLAIKDGIEGKELKNLGVAALLHDIGWAQLPLNLFGKAHKYTENELKVVQQHVKISNIIVSQSDDIHEITQQLILSHHERGDGSGYPESKCQEQLDPLARILIVADYYDEMVHGLLDRPGLISAEVLKCLYKESRINKLDKYYVEMLIKLLGIYPLCSAVNLSSHEKAVVVEVNRDKPLEPIVKIVYSAEGHALANSLVLDLKNDNKNRKIKSLISDFDKKVDPNNLLVMAET